MWCCDVDMPDYVLVQCTTDNFCPLYIALPATWKVGNCMGTLENIRKGKASLDIILKSCKCKAGYPTWRCSCRRKDSTCWPGRQCVNTYVQPPTSESTAATSEHEIPDLLVKEPEVRPGSLHAGHTTASTSMMVVMTYALLGGTNKRLIFMHFVLE